MKQIHVKTHLITFVSTFRPRIVSHTATRDLRDLVTGAAKAARCQRKLRKQQQRVALIDEIMHAAVTMNY